MVDIGLAEVALLLQASNKAAGSTVPTWVALVTALAAPIASGGGAYLTALATNRRERERLTHELQMKDVELEKSQEAERRQNLLAAYRAMSKTTKTIEAPEEPLEEMRDLSDTLAEIELLADSPELRKAATKLTVAAAEARNAREKFQQLKHARAGKVPADVASANKDAAEQTKHLRERFIKAARDELYGSRS